MKHHQLFTILGLLRLSRLFPLYSNHNERLRKRKLDLDFQIYPLKVTAQARQFKDYADALHNDALRRQQYSTDMAYSLSGGSSSSSSSYQSETIDPRLLYNEPDMPPSKFYGSRDVASFPQVPMSMGVLRLPLEDRPRYVFAYGIPYSLLLCRNIPCVI